MKTKIIVYFSLIIMLTSCKKLDLAPVNNLTRNTFYKTPEDAKAAVGSAYAAVSTIYRGGDFLFIDLATTDDGATFAGIGDRVPLWNYKITPENQFINQYNNSYQTIQRSNIVIAHIPLIPLSDVLKAQYVAEAKFLRALSYFNLVRLYGGVPLVTTETKSLDIDVPRASVNEVYALIEQDLKDAEAILPVSFPAVADQGRVTKGAAKGLFAKVYLTRAGTTAGSPYWALAASKAKEVMELNIYDLWANYADVFSLANKGGKEFVFEIQSKTDVLGSTVGRLYGVRSLPYAGGTGAGTCRVTPSLFNSYESADTRREVNAPTTYTYGGTTYTLSATITDVTRAIPFAKYLDVTSTTGAGGKSFPYMRYSEILLIYAEALNEVNPNPNINVEAYNAYKKVHDRSGLTTPLIGTFNYLTFKNAVWLERRLEFATEIQRRFDLVRTGRLIDAVESETSFGRTLEIQPFHYLLPIPQAVINSSPSVVQNPGY
jgi:hypothetical protein